MERVTAETPTFSIVSATQTSAKAVAITFDDGPNPEFTPQFVEIFREAGGRATFYMIGEQIERHPDTARLVHREGHEIGNHTYTHPNLTELDEETVRAELTRTRDLIEQTVGERPATFRPPFLAVDGKVERIARELGYPIVGCVNGDTRDWEMPGTAHIVKATRANMGPGSFLLFHDGFGDRSQSVEAVRMVVRELKAQGYALVTASELLGMK